MTCLLSWLRRESDEVIQAEAERWRRIADDEDYSPRQRDVAFRRYQVYMAEIERRTIRREIR